MKRKNIKVTCELCGSTRLSTLVDPHLKINDSLLTYTVCNDCGFTKKTHLALLKAQDEKKQYDFHENSLENEGYKAMLEAFLNETVSPFIGQGDVLEFGAGPGPVLGHLLKEKGFSVTLYDPFYHNDLDVFTKRYDLITSTEVFEHFHNPLKTIKTLVDLLKKDGLLAIQTSFKTDSNEAFLNWWYRRDLTHVSFYTYKSFQVIAKRFNLEILYTNHVNKIVLRKR